MIIRHTPNVDIVLGAGYGDEGKGKVVDYLVKTQTTGTHCIVRFSGGPQAGHTVYSKNRKKHHIHSSYGSGAFLRRTPTYLSEHVCVYLPNLMREHHLLSLHGSTAVPQMVINPFAKVITPYDVYMNRKHHKSDGTNKTCGLGIHQTMRRDETPYKLRMIDLYHPDIIEKLEAIKFDFYSINTIVPEEAEFLALIKDLQKYNLPINVEGYDYLNNFTNLVFEGSQGVLLDMDHGIFPYVTHARTTQANALEVLRKLGVPVERASLHMATRTYHTRHGDGKFPEIRTIKNPYETNVDNPFQGNFLTSILDHELLKHSIRVVESYGVYAQLICYVNHVDRIAVNKEFPVDYFDAVYYSGTPYSDFTRSILNT